MHINNKIIGLLLGGWSADAAGASLEFVIPDDITTEKIQKAINMKGGGPLGIGPGQITDDSELEMSMILGILDYIIKKSDNNTNNQNVENVLNNDSYNVNKCYITDYPYEEIAIRYIEWHKSRPFDIGLTTGKALAFSDNANDILNHSSNYNTFSQANGALMRISALPIFYYKYIDLYTIYNYCKEDAKFTHPNEICQEINGLYGISISICLLNHNKPEKVISELCLKHIDEYINKFVKSKEIKTWVLDSKDFNNIQCLINIGHLKHAFMLCIYFLNNIELYTYEACIKKILQQGRDTDTNAKIVGSLIGCIKGINNIPKYIYEPVLRYDNSKEYNDNGYIRPSKYRPLNVLKLLKKNNIILI